MPEFQKQEPGALYERTGEVRGRLTRVTQQGTVPDKLLSQRWKDFLHGFYAKNPNGGEARPKVEVCSSAGSLHWVKRWLVVLF
jgi:hypothetical protein